MENRPERFLVSVDESENSMSTERYFEHHDEVVELFHILKDTWIEMDPTSNVAKNFTPYHETFLDMARAVTQAGYHKTPESE
jgi:hypothetical protein